jgi:glycosyltransferase involved in cell wall biosynthesis
MQRLHCTRRARFLGNGVDLTRFDPTRVGPRVRAEVRSELGIDADTIVVGAVGRLVAEKGYRELFEAMERLPDRFRLVVVGGDDPEKPDSLDAGTVQRARDHGVQFLGHRDDVDRLYAAMDVFALASHREGFPRTAMEASAMGLPIVATDVRGCREVVDPGCTGTLVPRRDPAGLAGALLGFDDAELRARMGRAASQRARDHFDERRVVETVLATYRQVARQKGLDLSGL